MKFVKATYIDSIEVYTPITQNTLDKIDINPGDTILCFNDDGTLYGACGAVCATQVDTSKQLTYNLVKLLS